MMKMEKEIISTENIKPSSRTPPHLKTHKLSLLDQILPPIFVPLVLYFPVPENSPKNADEFFISQTTQNLKRSLSDTLTHFYPLAGRIKDSLSIDCNDEGVPFVVSKIRGTLSDFLQKLDPIQCRRHIPCELSWAEPGPGTHVATVQVNYFDCGAIAIGSLFLHKVTDGVTIGTFMKSWAASALGSAAAETIPPSYKAQSFFPQNEAMERDSYLFSAMKPYLKTGKTVMRRYVFDSSAISVLRSKLTAPYHRQGQGQGLEFRPSRVEIVSALIWKCFAASLSKTATTVVTHGVNMRRKADPPFPDQSFGNFVWLVPASSSTDATDTSLKHLVGKMRTAISRVDSDFVREMQGDEGFSCYRKNVEEAWDEFHENAEYLAISSWCNFGIYSVDFGWGKPVWMSKCDAANDTEWPFFNMVWLIDTVHGDGIEAWVTIDEKYSEAFDKNQEIRDFASVDPCPLDIAASLIKKHVLVNGHT